MSHPVPSKPVAAAMSARSDLNVFAAIAAILEGGTISGSNTAAAKIIKICHVEQQRQLRLMDDAIEKINKENQNGQ